MNSDQNHKTSASCSSQLEPRRKKGRRNVDTVGKEDTTRTEVTTENRTVKMMVSSSTNDVLMKFRLCKASGKLPTTKRGTSVVLRNNLAKGITVLQKSTTNPKQPPVGSYPVKTGLVLLNVLGTPMLPTSPSTHVGKRKVLVVRPNRSSSIRNPSVVPVYNPKPSACATSVLYVLYTRKPFLHTTAATKLQETAILKPDRQTSGRRRRTVFEQ